MTSTNVPVVIYGRISQDKDFTLSGVERHNRQCMAELQQRSTWRLAPITGSWKDPNDHGKGRWPDGVLVDNNVSGSGKKFRPEYQRLMEAVVGGQIKVVMTYSQARLFRGRIEKAQGFELFREHKVELRFVHGVAINFADASGRFVGEIQGAADTFYLETTQEAQRGAAADHAALGAYHGKRPFGFTRVAAPGEKRGMERSLVVNESEARWIREAYRLADPHGEAMSLYSICKFLDDKGVVTPTGLSWLEAGTGSLSGILTAARNIGKREHSPGWSGSGHRPEADTALHPGNWEPIIADEAMFWRVRNMLTDKSRRRPGPKTEAKYLLTGLVFCGNCDRRMFGRPNKGALAYVCQHCSTVRAQTAVNSKVLRVAFSWMAQNGPFDKATTLSEPAGLQAARIVLAGISAKRADALTDYRKGILTADDLKFVLTGLADDAEETEVKIREYERDLFASEVDARGDAFIRLWDQWEREGNAGLDKRRKFLSGLISRVVIHRAGHTNEPSPKLISVEPGAWAQRLGNPDEVAAPPIPDAKTLTSRGKAIAVFEASPGRWLSADDVARRLGRETEVTRNLITRMYKDGLLSRFYCQHGTAVANGDMTTDEFREANGGSLRGTGALGYQLRTGDTGDTAAEPYGGSVRPGTIAVPSYSADSRYGKAIAVFAAAPGQWLTKREISTGIGADPNTAYNLMLRMYRDGVLVRQWFADFPDHNGQAGGKSRKKAGNRRGHSGFGYQLRAQEASDGDD